jgi:polyisoprenoid-binding protein YceI
VTGLRQRLFLGTALALLLGGGVIVFVLYSFVLGGKAPQRFSLQAAASARPASSTATVRLTAGPGTWSVAGGSQAGYRVREQLGFAAAPSDAVGRTSQVSGSMTISRTASGYSLDAASLTVDVSSLTSDRPMRDQRLHQMGLDSDQYPAANFVLSNPVLLPATAANGQPISVQAQGTLTVHGVTRQVTIPMRARLSGSTIEATGSMTFPFEEFGMTPPSIGGFVSVQDSATMEFDVFFAQ